MTTQISVKQLVTHTLSNLLIVYNTYFTAEAQRVESQRQNNNLCCPLPTLVIHTHSKFNKYLTWFYLQKRLKLSISSHSWFTTTFSEVHVVKALHVTSWLSFLLIIHYCSNYYDYSNTTSVIIWFLTHTMLTLFWHNWLGVRQRNNSVLKVFRSKLLKSRL